MKKYAANAASEGRLNYGTELGAGLEEFPETAGYAPGFAAVNDSLDASWETRRVKRKVLGKARAKLRIADFSTNRTIREFARAVEGADGGRQGQLYGSLLPDGLSVVVGPAGLKQVKPFGDLIDRVKKCKLPGSDKLRETWLGKLQDMFGRLSAVAKTYTEAQDAYLDAFKDELALREEHELAVDKLMGEVRSAFPKDRAKQDAVFPPASSSRSSDDDADDAETASEEKK